jgi:hypothetical protein
MATLMLPETAPQIGPSDADLLNVTLSLLSAMPGPHLTQPLSDVTGFTCSIVVPEDRDRAVRLELRLAEYLHERHALLRTADVSSAGLDAWAGRARIDVVRAAIVCCARHAGGAR